MPFLWGDPLGFLDGVAVKCLAPVKGRPRVHRSGDTEGRGSRGTAFGVGPASFRRCVENCGVSAIGGGAVLCYVS